MYGCVIGARDKPWVSDSVENGVFIRITRFKEVKMRDFLFGIKRENYSPFFNKFFSVK